MITVLFSGGIDSFACMVWAIEKFGKDNVQPIFAILHNSYREKEYQAAAMLCAMLGMMTMKVVQLPMLSENIVDAHIPLRNTFLLLSAACLPDSEGVVFGMLKGESCEDKNPRYIGIMQALFDEQFKASIYRSKTRKFVIYTPFAKHTKAQLFAWCKVNAPWFGLDLTVGCFKGSDKPCGICASCLNRWVGRYLNDLSDEKYLQHPFVTFTSFLSRVGKERKDNPKLLSTGQLWLKRYWIIDVARAMHRYSKKNFNEGLALYLWRRS